jgi:arginase family enzyme
MRRSFAWTPTATGRALSSIDDLESNRASVRFLCRHPVRRALDMRQLARGAPFRVVIFRIRSLSRSSQRDCLMTVIGAIPV